MVIPTTVNNYQAIADDVNTMNNLVLDGEIMSDNYFLEQDYWQSLSPSGTVKYYYIWDQDIYKGVSGYAWRRIYSSIFAANAILDGIVTVERDERNFREWDNVKGSALFFRSLYFLQLQEIFGAIYRPESASTDLGIPLKLTEDPAEKLKRATVQETFDQIINDLKTAMDLLPEKPAIATRPSFTAGSSILSRIYLILGNYEQAKYYTELALEKHSFLLDYNDFSTSSSSPFLRFNEEVIFHSTMNGNIRNFTIDTVLYHSYADNDLRKQLFFRNIGVNRYVPKGSYQGNILPFGGVSAAELYLNRAECYAREGNTAAAMTSLNTLLEKRWLSGTFDPLTANGADEALSIILEERRKELIWRGLRWSDLRRLNKDPRFAKTLVRIIDGRRIELPPNHPNYVLPIPDEELLYNNFQQNPREQL